MKKIKTSYFIPLSKKAAEKEVGKNLERHIRFIGMFNPKFKGCDQMSGGGGS